MYFVAFEESKLKVKVTLWKFIRKLIILIIFLKVSSGCISLCFIEEKVIVSYYFLFCP